MTYFFLQLLHYKTMFVCFYISLFLLQALLFGLQYTLACASMPFFSIQQQKQK